ALDLEAITGQGAQKALGHLAARRVVRAATPPPPLHPRATARGAGAGATSASAGRRLAGTDEGAHELAIHLGRDGVGVDPRSGQELARVLHAVDPGRLEVDGLEPRLREPGAVLLFLERPRDTADPELDTAADLRGDLTADHDIGYRETPARAEHPERLGEHPVLVRGEVDHAVGADDVHGVVGQRDRL